MALRHPKEISSDERFDAWVRVIERVYDEQTTQGWRHRYFRLVQAIFNTNQSLHNDGYNFYRWMVYNYIDSALMMLRRELDVQSGTENLRNLLEDIINNPGLITRSRYLALWRPTNTFMAHLANQTFDSFTPIKVAGSPNEDFIDTDSVQSDLNILTHDTEKLRKYAERTRAHRTPLNYIENKLTFDDLHTAIEDTRRIVGKYYALLTQKSLTEWEPVPQFNIFRVFEKPWITDIKAVRKSMDQ